MGEQRGETLGRCGACDAEPDGTDACKSNTSLPEGKLEGVEAMHRFLLASTPEIAYPKPDVRDRPVVAAC
jgi:hypothetical protein